MIRYYCNKCEALLSTKYTVVVKLPDGTQQNAVHLCSDCYKRLQRFYSLMNKKEEEETEQSAGEKAKDEIAKQLGISSETNDNAGATRSGEVSQAGQLHNGEASDPAPKSFEEGSIGSASFNGKTQPDPKIVGKFVIKEELPGRPRSENDLPKIRRILIDFYREVAPKTTQTRLGMDNLTWRRWVSKYASTTVYARWGNYKRFAEPGKERAIDTNKVLTLAGGGFPVKEIAKEIDCDDEGLINEILYWYTGV